MNVFRLALAAICNQENLKQFLHCKNETKLATEWNKNLSYDKYSQ